ncbi:MAG: 30S ribosomal protein S16 [Candidatus Shapirobacteria bacterium]
MVKIRFAQTGKKNQIKSRIVVIESKNCRDGKALEILGTPEKYKAERVAYWQERGAQLTPAVAKIVNKNGQPA